MSTQIKKIKKSQKQVVTLIEKSKPKKQKTVNYNRKEIALLQYENQAKEAHHDHHHHQDPHKLSGSEVENFSEIININSNQDEILELESFIQKEQSRIK